MLFKRIFIPFVFHIFTIADCGNLLLLLQFEEPFRLVCLTVENKGEQWSAKLI